MTQNNIKYRIYNFVLEVDNELFDPDDVTARSKVLQRKLRQLYWNIFTNFFLADQIMIIKLSGLHFNIDAVKKYLVLHDSKTNAILHYHCWQKDKGGAIDIDSFAIIECRGDLLKEIFDVYWFTLGYEIKLKIFAMAPKVIFDVNPKLFCEEGKSKAKEANLLSKTFFILDNCENGFHFSMIINEKYEKMIGKTMDSLLRMMGSGLEI